MRRTGNGFPRLVLPVVAAGSALVMAGCSVGNGASGTATTGARPAASGVPVAVAPVVRKDVPIELQVIGTAEASSTVAIRAQLTGELTSVHFSEGDDVTQGQVLFTLDRRPFESALKQAEANLARDVAQAANARAQAQRYQDLAARGIATKEQVETAGTSAAALEATVAADRAAVDSARVQVELATIEAPISGRTGTLMVHPGNLVRANDTSPLVVINQVSPILVSFGVPETNLASVRQYLARGELQVGAQPPSDEGAPSMGRISFIDNAVDQTTGTIRVKGTFPNADRRLWPGQYVNVVLKLATERGALVVPTVAVQTGQQGQYVFVVKDDQTVEVRPVTVARTNGTESIIGAGLSGGETIVTDGQLRLASGSRIAVKSE
jgi:multidrug efflux system membrane fusion protein